MHKLLSGFLLAIGMVCMLSSCASKSNEQLVGKEFQLVNASDGVQITIRFLKNENRFAGNASVNRYFGVYKISGSNINLSEVGSTMMMGPENLMKSEAEYLHFLSTVKSYKLNGKKLFLTGSKTLEFEQIGNINE